MRISILIATFLTFFGFKGTYAQFGNFEEYFEPEHNTKHFISFGYGQGNTSWYSRTEGYELYDQRGNKVLSGDYELTAETRHHIFQMDALFPLGPIRLGMGIGFDEFFLYKLHVEDPSLTRSVAMIEEFRFDKIHLTVEIPTRLLKSDDIFLDLSARFGYYGFSKVNSLSLFGEKRLGTTYFASLGAVGNIRLHEQLFFFVLPKVEYKHFDNSNRSPKGAIYHNLVSYDLLGGLRYQML